MPCTPKDKELLEKILFPEQDQRFIDCITLIMRKTMVGALPVR